MFKKIPPSELKIMKLFWQSDKVLTSQDIVSIMSHEWKQTTTLTLLSRLVKRNFLSAEKHTSYTTYTVLVDEESYLQYETFDFLKNIHNESVTSLLQSMSKKEFSKEEIKTFKNFIKDIQNKKQNG
ncbi:TPA: BlaI/MecI/CopY family transcriptional regulator [Clostridioides difficile]|nr:BlaI/MecI/CopY family transcriptional regulator [Clostridioides difficile]